MTPALARLRRVTDTGRGVESLKGWFFDRPAVQRLADRAKLRVLSRMGAFVRQRARTSIRTRRAASRPGQPPSSHTGLLKRWILFAYDPAAASVVVGPAALNWVQFRGGVRARAGTVPEALEYGGGYEVLEVLRYGRWRRADLRSRRRLAGLPTRYRPVAIAARPYMRPALAAEVGRFPGLFAAGG